MDEILIIENRITDSINTKKRILNDSTIKENIAIISKDIYKTLKNGGKLLICGNGGSASDSLHMAGEIVGRFQKERKAWPAIALNADTVTMTAIANDYGYKEVFARLTEAYMTEKDILIGISTSGNSENVLRAILKAKKKGGKTIGLLGMDGGKIIKEADYSLVVSDNVTARIQESHIMIIHILCELVEEMMMDE